MALKKSQRDIVYMKYGGLCAYCGSQLGTRWHGDHIDPVLRISEYAKGSGFKCTGKMANPELDVIDNFNPACAPCNLYKGSLTIEEWRRGIQHLNDLLVRDSGPFRHALRFGLVVETKKPVVFYFETISKEHAN